MEIICLAGLGIGLILAAAVLTWGLCRSAKIGEDISEEAIREWNADHIGDL